MTLARAEVVIQLAGNPTDQQQEGIMGVDEIIEESDQMVYDYTRTAAEDWIEDVTSGFSWARQASEYLAASKLSSMFHDINQRADMYNKTGMDKLKTLRQIGYGTKDGDNPSFQIASSYKAVTPASPTTRYRSNNFFGGGTDY